MATNIETLRFDRRRSKLATELVASLSPEERIALALVMRHTVSGQRTRSGGASLLAVIRQRPERPSGPRIVKFDESVVTDGISTLLRAGWLRFACQHGARGNFWMTSTAEAITSVAGMGAKDLDPEVPA